MALFKKKQDPISDRTKALNAEIAALESQIKSLNSKLDKGGAPLRVRSTMLPDGHKIEVHPAVTEHEPVFEQILPPVSEPPAEVEDSARYNDYGVRKFDLIAAWRKLRNVFREPPAHNPKLISYLAAGSIKGLRPLRYEKRIARNRFIALSIFFVLLLWGILAVVFKN